MVISLLFLIGCADKNTEIRDTPEISLRFCMKCERRADVRKHENKVGSNLLLLSNLHTRKFYSNKLFPIYITERFGYSSARSLCDFFQRESSISFFNEYALYCYKLDQDEYFEGLNDTLFQSNFTIEFNCGTEPFGYDTTKANIEPYWEGRYPGLIPVRDVPIDSFKLGYYSIIKWLYNQETERYKVKKKKYEQFDHDYGPTASLITSENLVLEDPWQKEFLFTTYELIDTHSKDSYDYPRFTVVPYTLAPIHLYEVRPLKSEREKYVYKPDKYHINVADMAIRVYRYPTYEEMQKH